MSQLVVITGPIGSGKSTVAAGLAAHVQAGGRSAAVVDLDDVVGMVRAPRDRFERSWQQARKVHGELVAAWLRTGLDIVIAHGPFYTDEETGALLGPVQSTISPRHVMLLCSYEAALTRVTPDAERGVSRDPQFLRSAHERFQQLLPHIAECEWVFDTTVMSADDIVVTLAGALALPRGGRAH
jgi:shikimate kinase